MPILFIAVIVIMGSFAMLLPGIMFVLANMGVSTAMSTPVLAVYSLAQFLLGPQWGRLSDRVGRKKTLYSALFLGGSAYLGMAMSSGSLYALFVTMAFAGGCAGALAVVFASVADMTSAKNRTRGMGVIGAAIGLSFVIGTAVGGSMAGETAETATIVGPTIGSSLACFTGALLVFFFFKETHKENARALGGPQMDKAVKQNRLAAFYKIARHPSLLKLCFLILVFTSCVALMEPIIPKYVFVHFSWGPQEMRNVFIFVGCVLVLVQGGLVGPLARRFGETKLARAGLCFMAAGLALLGFVPDQAVLYAALTFTSVGTAFFSASSLSLASHEADVHEKGAVLGVAQSMQALGRSLGPLMAGLLFDVHVGLPFWTGMTTILVLLIVFQRLMHQFQADAQ